MTKRPAVGPLVSIIIPCFNQGRFLPQAIDSALEQTYPQIEVIVVNDGSTDETADVVARYRSRITHIRRQNGGLSAARNTGIHAASGDLVLFLDSDDYLFPDAVEKHIAAERRMPRASVFIGAFQEVDQDGHVLSPIKQYAWSDDLFHALLMNNQYHVHATMVRTSVFTTVGLFDTSLRASEDWDFFLRLAAARLPFVRVPDAVAVYRRYPGTMCTRYELMWRTGCEVLRKGGFHDPGCEKCRRAIRGGRAHLRRWCFQLLKEDLRRSLTADGAPKALVKASRECFRNPELALMFLAAPSRPMRRAAGRLRRKLIPSRTS